MQQKLRNQIAEETKQAEEAKEHFYRVKKLYSTKMHERKDKSQIQISSELQQKIDKLEAEVKKERQKYRVNIKSTERELI